MASSSASTLSSRLLSLCCSSLLQLQRQAASGRLAATTTAAGWCSSSTRAAHTSCSGSSRSLLQRLGAGSSSAATGSPSSRGFAAGGRVPPGPHQPNPANAAARGPPAARAGARGPAGAAAGGRAPPGAATDAAGTTAAAAAPSGLGRWWAAFKGVPTVPKVLGLAGALPFLAFAPPVTKHLAGLLPDDVVDNCAMIQVCYGVTIVTFLGAVHWGVAMASPVMGAAGGALGARLANEAFVYSVLPSLVAWPVALMEPGAGSIVLSLLLPACYAADYTRRNLGLPGWYMALRAPLTLLATFGVLLTANRHVFLEVERAKALAAEQQQQQQGAAS